MNDEIHVHVVQEKDRANLTMRYKDPMTGRHVKRSAGTANRKVALKKAAQWEAELIEGRYQRPNKISWAEFREVYEAEKLSALSQGTRAAAASALNHFERVIGPERLASVTSAVLSRFQADLRKEGMQDTTIDAHLGHLQACLKWAVANSYLRAMPVMHRPKRVKGRRFARGRAIVAEEYERMVQACETVRPHDAEAWKRYLNGLWLSGLRLEESLALSWDESAHFAVDLGGKHPRFRIAADAQKSGRDQLLPMTPDFAEWLLKTPKRDRHGRVFRIVGLQTGEPTSPKRVSKILTKIGQKAGVVVNREVKKVREKIIDPATGKPTGRTKLVEREVSKYASAHDLRRSFGTRWAKRVMPATLKLLMRHSSVETSMRYYVEMDADDVAADLWSQHRAEPEPKTGGLGTSLGTTGQGSPQNDTEAPSDDETQTVADQ
jgi:integrase